MHKGLNPLTSEALFGAREIVDPDDGTTMSETEFIELIDGMCADVIAPLVERLRRQKDVDAGAADIKESLMGLGVHLFALPSEYGGQRNLVTPRILAEFTMRTGRVGGLDVGLYFGASNELFMQPMISQATKELKDLVFPLLAQGETGCFGLTEEGAGSNPVQMETKIDLSTMTVARSPGKRFITSAPQSRFAIVIGVSNERIHSENPREGMTAVLLDREAGGFETGAPENKLGLHWSLTSDVIIPQGAPIVGIIGMPGQGYVQVALESLAHSRATGIPAQFSGLGEHIYLLAHGRAFNSPDEGGRVQFGRNIGKFGDITDLLLNIETRAWLSRLLTMHSSTLRQDNMSEWKMWEGYASMAKLYVTEAVRNSALEGVQIHGGDGFMNEFPITTAYKDAPIGGIYEGTSQIQKFVILKRNIGPMLRDRVVQAKFMAMPARVLANDWPLMMLRASESGDGSSYAKKMGVISLRARFIAALRRAYRMHKLTPEIAASMDLPAVYYFLTKVDASIYAAELGAWQADYLDKSHQDVVSEFGTDLEKLLHRAVSMGHAELEFLERAFL